MIMDLTKLIFKREQFRLALANVTECFNDAYRFNFGCEDGCSAGCANNCSGTCDDLCAVGCTGCCGGNCDGTCDYTCDTSCAIGTTNEYNGCDIYNK